MLHLSVAFNIKTETLEPGDLLQWYTPACKDQDELLRWYFVLDVRPHYKDVITNAPAVIVRVYDLATQKSRIVAIRGDNDEGNYRCWTKVYHS